MRNKRKESLLDLWGPQPSVVDSLIFLAFSGKIESIGFFTFWATPSSDANWVGKWLIEYLPLYF